MDTFIITQMKMLKILKLKNVKICLIKNGKFILLLKMRFLIGGLVFLNDWIIRSETSNALGKIFVKNVKTGMRKKKLNLLMKK